MSFRALCVAAAVAAATWLGGDVALAESRLALVIGNSAYQSVAPLTNPANDAKAMSDLLTAAGFDVVAVPDLTQDGMRRAIGDFAGKVSAKGRDTVALVYYAGHGVQIDGENFLVPVDAHVERESDVPLQAVRLADVMNALAAVPSKTRIVILDACRNNPFSAINKTAGHGLAIVDAPTGSLVSYATSPGAEAEDGAGADSPYTSALIKIARQPGLPLEQALKRVRLAVHETTDGRQTPWESSSLTSDFFFFGQPGEQGAARLPPGTAGGWTIAGARRDAHPVDYWRRQLQALTPREAYQIVIREDVVEAYEAFIALYPQTPFVPRVRSLFDRRGEMVDWYIAVALDTIAAYQEFLSKHPNSDQAATARRLMQRSATRSLIDAQHNPARLANVASPGPTCPCTTPTPERRTDQPQRGQNFTVLPPLPTPLPPAPPPVVVVPPVVPPVVVRPPGDGHPSRGPGGSTSPRDPGGRGPTGNTGPTGPTGPTRTPPVVSVPNRPPVITLPPNNKLPPVVHNQPIPRLSGPPPRFVRPSPNPRVRLLQPRFGGPPPIR